IMPGGFGTMDELFETLTLIQTKTITQFPVVLFGKKYYQQLMDSIEEMVNAGTINKTDMNLLLLTDDIDEAMQHVTTYIQSNYTIKRRRKKPWLFERR
ncbi:MAG TPA: LOG family protein, partial [Chitinophagaceae bacterium]|nr:LOG family protein [Chitinophagaceae bacterium]